MGTEVLRPQDCLIERIRVAPAGFNRRKSCYNGNPNPRFRKPVVRQDQKRQSNSPPEPSISKRSSSSDDLRKSSNNNLVNGQVTILRRGESHDLKIKAELDTSPAKKSGGDLVAFGTERLGPDPEMVLKQIRIADLKPAMSSPASSGGRPDMMYAGSAFSMSPSPRSLPLPSFFSKKQVSRIAVDDSATRDLRRLLRLD